MTTISAVMLAYNEEARIESVLRSVAWCDEILVLDKCSTDRTREIASRYARVITTPPLPSFGAECERLRAECASEWILTLTCSGLVTPALADEVRRLISDENFAYDVIEVPFRRFVLGFEGPRSPWFSTFNRSIARRRVLRYRTDTVHNAISFTSDRVYRIEPREGMYLYHLTHPDLDGMMERHVRYCRAEGELTSQRVSLPRAAGTVLRSLYDVTFRRRTWQLGWDGVALAFAWISYWMLRYLYVWETKRGKRSDVYAQIIGNVLDEWDRRKQ